MKGGTGLRINKKRLALAVSLAALGYGILTAYLNLHPVFAALGGLLIGGGIMVALSNWYYEDH